MRRGLAALAAIAVVAALSAPGVRAEGWQAEFGAARETLSGERPSWTQVDAALRRAWAPGTRFELFTRRTERFELVDRELAAGLALPLSERWSLSLGTATSPTHRVLPHGSAEAGLQFALGDGWVAGAAFKRTRYDTTHSSGRYAGAWRAAAAWIHTRLDGGRSTDAGRLQLDHFFSDDNRLGLIVASGREVDDAGAAQVNVLQVDTVALVGRWRLAPGWALVGDLGSTRVGSIYRRNGGRLGVQLDF
jgi:YaiO family outer membrane protein